jgi:hypothetical protein
MENTMSNENNSPYSQLPHWLRLIVDRRRGVPEAEPRFVSMQHPYPMQHFFEATGQHSEARRLALLRALEHEEARAVDRANESEAFPMHYRRPGT